MGDDGIAAAEFAQRLFGGLCLNGNGLDGEAECLGYVLPDGIDVLPQLGRLEDDGGIDVDDGVGGQLVLEHTLEQLHRVDVLVGGIGVGEVGADVPLGQGAEEGVDEGVDEHIAIAVGKRSLFTGDFYASDDERFAGGDEAMEIPAASDPDHRLLSRWYSATDSLKSRVASPALSASSRFCW